MVSTTKQEKWNFPLEAWEKLEEKKLGLGNRGLGENGFKILWGLGLLC